MTRAEACKVLQVAPTADDEIITQAYWHLARRYQATAGRDREARQRLDELHQAYRLLNPAAAKEASPEESLPAVAEQPSFGQILADLGRLMAQISSRWRGRTIEVAILVMTTAWLGFLALSAGANAFWTILALAIAGVAIWAPWRRVSPPES